MLKNALRDLNRLFPQAGLPKPTTFLNKHGLTPSLEYAMESLGVREYYTVTYPANGGSLRVAVRKADPWLLMENRGFEYSCIDQISSRVRKGANLIDIGAGSGIYTLLFSMLAGEDGRVRAFEPDPESRMLLCDNIRKNRAANVKVDKRCISNSSGTAVLRSMRWGTGLSTIMKEMCPNPSLEKVVPSTSVDDFCEEQGFAPDGIKVDAEGAERLVLEGARETMREYRPWLLVELHGGSVPTDQLRKLWRLLVDRAKSVVLLSRTGNLHRSSVELSSLSESDFSHVFVEY